MTKAENKDISTEEAITIVDPQDLMDVLFSTADEIETEPRHRNSCSPGRPPATLLSVDAVLETVDAGEEAIMFAMETGPEDEPGMRWSSGIATAHGGLASHAAIYSRGLGLPAVCGIAELTVTESSIDIGGITINEGSEISINGTTGEVHAGK
ncbi:MAG: hypothetical protein CM15mP49_00430 [Actinomycetota bacterium]|nr:MAG: hypothetical protein CM15mP49_00430 [Actinomycetota bacterium]